MDITAVGNWFLLAGKQWASSLSIFLPQNIKLFLLITLNAFLKSTKVFFNYFWWMLLINSAALAYFFLFDSVLVRFLWDMALWFVMLLAIRPSIPKKTYSYFLNYVPRYFLLTAFVMLTLLLQLIIINLVEDSAIGSVLVHRIFLSQVHRLYVIVPSVLFLYVGYFLLDSDGTILQAFSSVLRGVKMFVYTFPFCLISMAIFIASETFIVRCITYFFGIPYSFFINTVILWLGHMWIGCWFNTLYIKKAHEDFHLYFE